MTPKFQKFSQQTLDQPMLQHEPYNGGKYHKRRNVPDTFKTIKPQCPVSINHSPERLEIKIGLQSFCKEEVHLHITQDTIYLNAAHKKKRKQSLSSEYSEDVSRIFTIPSDTICEKIKTTFLKHEMKISLPKTAKKPPRDIDFS